MTKDPRFLVLGEPLRAVDIFVWKQALDTTPRDHPEPLLPYFGPDHPNCRCVLALNARDVTIEGDTIDLHSDVDARPVADIMAELETIMSALPTFRIARYGPWGGLTQYGKEFRGRIARVYGAPPPLSKRARRRARGKAKS